MEETHLIVPLGESFLIEILEYCGTSSSEVILVCNIFMSTHQRSKEAFLFYRGRHKSAILKISGKSSTLKLKAIITKERIATFL